MKKSKRIFTALVLSLSGTAAYPSSISIINRDGEGEGFNDATPVEPVAGNPGTTRGMQRFYVFQRAANQWGSTLDSNVPILVQAGFDPQTCTMTSATLGSAGPNYFLTDFVGAPLPATAYPAALANAMAGMDLGLDDPSTFTVNEGIDIITTFNSRIDELCFGPLPGGYWYGTEALPPGPPALASSALYSTLLHELGHGLGFTSGFSGATGAFYTPDMPIWGSYLYDTELSTFWIDMNNAQRAASALNDPDLTWTGPNVTLHHVSWLQEAARLIINSPAGVAGDYPVQSASFGSMPPRPAGTGGLIAAVNDGSTVIPPGGTGTMGTTTDGCNVPFVNAAEIVGKIALVDRGQCNFTDKAKNAQNAGAIGILVAHNAASGFPSMGGNDPTVTIPAFGITQALGVSIRSESSVNATLGYSSELAGTSGGYVRMYAPSTFSAGSSVSHFTTEASPNLLMEPFDSGTLLDQIDLTLDLFKDIGWAQTFAPANTAPTVNIPSDLSATEDAQVTIPAIGFSDAEVGGSLVMVTLDQPGLGTFSTTGISSGVRTAGIYTDLSIVGTLSAINAAFASGAIRYQLPTNAAGSLSINVGINDIGANSSGAALNGFGSLNINIAPVNDAPTITAPPTLNLLTGQTSIVSGIGFDDAEIAVHGGNLTVTFTAPAGSGTFEWLFGGAEDISYTGSGTNQIVLAGSVASLNFHLESSRLRFTPAAGISTGSISIGINASDNGTSGSGGPQSAMTTVPGVLVGNAVFANGYE